MRSIKNKKGDGGLSSTLVIMTAAAISLLVLLMITGGFAKIFKSITGKNECQMEFLVSSFTKTGGMQMSEPNCEPHLVTIDQKYLDTNKPRADKFLKDYSDKYASKYESSGKYVSKFMGSTDATNEWMINEAFAKEMKYCWDITGRGNLNLFSNWEGMLECQFDGAPKHPCTPDEIQRIYSQNKVVAGISGVLGWVAGKYTNGIVGPVSGAALGPVLWERLWGNVKKGDPPMFCVICARIKFDKNLQSKATQGSLGMWLANTPVTDGSTNVKVSYAQYIENDNFRNIIAGYDSYPFNTQESYAVVYARQNSFVYTEAFKKVASTFSSYNGTNDLQLIKVIPYKTIQDECTLLVG